jgi:hypothetical protein
LELLKEMTTLKQLQISNVQSCDAQRLHDCFVSPSFQKMKLNKIVFQGRITEFYEQDEYKESLFDALMTAIEKNAHIKVLCLDNLVFMNDIERDYSDALGKLDKIKCINTTIKTAQVYKMFLSCGAKKYKECSFNHYCTKFPIECLEYLIKSKTKAVYLDQSVLPCTLDARQITQIFNAPHIKGIALELDLNSRVKVESNSMFQNMIIIKNKVNRLVEELEKVEAYTLQTKIQVHSHSILFDNVYYCISDMNDCENLVEKINNNCDNPILKLVWK